MNEKLIMINLIDIFTVVEVKEYTKDSRLCGLAARTMIIMRMR